MSYEINFERIGRNHSVEDLRVDSADPDEIARAVHRHARRHLASSEYGVVVNLDEMRGSIGAGRFGRFTIKLVGEDT